MSQINHYSAAEKLLIIKELETDLTRNDVAHKYGISVTTLVKWRRRYELYGYEGLEIRTQYKSYSLEQ